MRLKPITLLFVLLSFFQAQAQAQNNKPDLFFAQYDEAMNWVRLQEHQSLSATQFFQETASLYGLQNARDMKVVRTKSDNLGWTHYKHHQFFQGVRVEGGTYLLHEKDGKVVKANGVIYPAINLNTQAGITAEVAIEKAKQRHPATTYLWENESAERLLKKVKENSAATYYPQPELVIVDRTYPVKSGDMVLSYKLDLQLQDPIGRYTVYVDAQNGSIIQSYNNLHPTAIDGTAETRYHGTQTISTIQESPGGRYMLRDTSRGVIIETLDSWNDSDIVPFYDDDNYWDNVNDHQDDVATDAHYGAMTTYDFYKENFDRHSYDDNGASMTSLVHVGIDWNNASWNGFVMSYGDGDGSLFNPLTAVDVCGHELTHAVTEHSAGLVYAYESGALNESFSDVFGKAIEYAADPAGFSWLLGERIMVVPGASIRTMQDPNLVGDPKFYQGAFWHTAPSDNGGVHTNSGVQNYWFVLMVDGGQGVAENGYAFDIAGLGWEKANQIAYRNLTEYLTPSSDFLDAREGALQAATDLFGFCSMEYIMVSKAWAAVGVGYEVRDGDYVLELDRDLVVMCDLTELEVTIQFYNNGCNESLASGTSIPLVYQVDGTPQVEESILLTSDMEPGGQEISYTFAQKAAVSGYGEHLLKVWANTPNDAVPENNYQEISFINRPEQSDDFALRNLRNPGGVCDYEPTKIITAAGVYHGCDSLAPTELPFSWFYKGTTFSDLELTFIKMAPFDELPIVGEIYFTEFGFGNGTFRLDFPDDSNMENNIGSFYLARLDQLTEGWKEEFSVSGLDSTHLGIYQTPYTNCGIQIFDDYSYIMSGSEIVNDFGNLLVRPHDDPEAFMRFNSDFVTTMDLCLDVAGMDNPYLFFDLAQTRSTVDYQQYDIEPTFSTMFGVFIDGVQIGPLIYGNANNGEFVAYEYDLNGYKDGQHHLELRALGLTASLAPNDNLEIDGDNNIVDYIQIANKINISTKQPLAPEVMKISPNPSTGTFYLTREDGETFNKGSIKVFDASGKLLVQDLLEAATSNYAFGATLAPGIYFVRVVDGEHSGYSKIVKQ